MPVRLLHSIVAKPTTAPYIDGHTACEPQDAVGGTEGLPQQWQLGWGDSGGRPIMRLQRPSRQSCRPGPSDLTSVRKRRGGVPRRPASERADGPMNGPGEGGPNHEPPTGRYGAGLNPGRGASSAVVQTVASGSDVPRRTLPEPPRGRDELAVCAPCEHRTALLSMPRTSPTRRGVGRSRMGTESLPSRMVSRTTNDAPSRPGGVSTPLLRPSGLGATRANAGQWRCAAPVGAEAGTRRRIAAAVPNWCAHRQVRR